MSLALCHARGLMKYLDSKISRWNGTLTHGSHVLSFRKIDEPLGWLSNMSKHPIRVNKVLYPTCEHFFQCSRFENEEIVREILKSNSPMTGKMISKKYSSFHRWEVRGFEDLQLMRTVIRIKMFFYPKLRMELENQEEGTVIVEDCSKRGGESSRFCGMKLEDGVWTGQNWLGRLWMELRSELKGEDGVSLFDPSRFPGTLLHDVTSKFQKKAA